MPYDTVLQTNASKNWEGISSGKCLGMRSMETGNQEGKYQEKKSEIIKAR